MNNIILELDFLLQSVGTFGIVIFYLILAKLSALMGKGLRLGSYYLWYYVAIIITLLTIPIHLFLHLSYETIHSLDADLEVIYVSFLLLSNIIVIIVSIKYWWWLKSELLG
ncbi:MAG: hypothetical protein C3F06_13610 [Candidatus Methanoperedenaceae archaeon]|nr:MAG: hypothetical protein C3F06_13610 [Candidatus Methanoperedenaceae archaeon]